LCTDQITSHGPANCKRNANICVATADEDGVEKCFSVGAKHPQDECLACAIDGHWTTTPATNENKRSEEVKVFYGDTFRYNISSEYKFNVVLSPPGSSLTDAGVVEWRAVSNDVTVGDNFTEKLTVDLYGLCRSHPIDVIEVTVA
jgi:hypothetical protein